MQPQSLAMVQPQEFCESTFLDQLREEVGVKNFESWFNNKVSFQVNQDELSLGVANPFLLNWMQNQFRSSLTCLAQRFLGPSARVRFVVEAGLQAQNLSAIESKRLKKQSPSQSQQPVQASVSTEATKTEAAQAVLASTAAAANTPSARRSLARRGHARRTGRKYASLSDFISGNSNQLACTAAMQACQFPGERFNPLYLHANVGLGKTHLLEGMYKSVKQLHPGLNVLLITAESFSNYFTQALRDRTLPSFRQKFRNIDVLLLDDVDFLESKPVIQEEFLHTFKQLESKGCQIVLTSDRHPRLLTKTSTELTTRFLSGLVCKIEAPDRTTREQILQHKSLAMKSPLSPSVLKFVAQRFQQNVRELEGALNCLETHRLLEANQKLSVNAARKILADLERDCIQIIRATDIDTLVAGFFGITPDELKSSSRSRQVSLPRMIAIYLTRKHTEAAYKEIGQHFGGRNHSTIMSAEKKIRHSLKEGAIFKIARHEWPARELIDTLERQLLAS